LTDGRRLRIWQAAAIDAAAGRSSGADSRTDPGTIVATGHAGIDVATADGVLRLERIQPVSGRVMDASAYLAAHSVEGAAFVS
ncbi:MAG TPA: methionyl-tRNA formyltransferase, partial [Gammaproteobacteria bacterium]|nr:methionyl-tRNA formyltransferase [Gammaproteobacteria bacterium]